MNYISIYLIFSMGLDKKVKLTPLMKQYNQIKVKYPDALLLFRVGDFYETFGEDAIKASKILGIILTKKGAGSMNEIELAGFPYHSINNYLPKLVKAGCRVAICDQLENPKLTKKLVKRGVTELVTPGVAINDDVLEHNKNNYLSAITFGKKKSGISFMDISTGDFSFFSGSINQIKLIIEKYNPAEIIISKLSKKEFQTNFESDFTTFFQEDWVFDYENSYDSLKEIFETKTLKGFGVENDDKEGIIAAGVVLHYLSETQHNKLAHIKTLKRIDTENYLSLDKFTTRNLELNYSTNGGVSLIDVIDFTTTSIGSRLLKKWLNFPLKSIKKLKLRHDFVEILLNEKKLTDSLIDHLKEIVDIERIASKIATSKVNPRELVSLKKSIGEIQKIKNRFEKNSNDLIVKTGKKLVTCETIFSEIEKTIKEDVPVSVSKGNFIAEGFSKELDELREILRGGKSMLDKILKQELLKNDIPSLKIGFNNIFGYYFEVRNTHKEKVPNEWIRKQTLVNAERYVNEDLKNYETKILGAEEKIQELELRYYSKLLNSLQKNLDGIMVNSILIGKIDCFLSFAIAASKFKFCKPVFNESNNIEIIQGRHPVIEQNLDEGELFIPNDIRLDQNNQQIMMISGPNMSGKSAILRQTALIIIMAQIGSFVPAKKVNIGITDKIFTRVGASDNISQGESTFMVEMNESAAILNNLTSKSLILLDEIGRGTSTYDGISIAWAITEYLHQHPLKPKTLFATHYHELNVMKDEFKRIKNFNVSVMESDNNILFLRKLEPEGSEHSFGIHVAKMAGLPKEVIDIANQKLKFLEKSRNTSNRKKSLSKKNNEIQLSFISLDDPLIEELKQEILKIDIDNLKPLDALLVLNKLKKKLDNG
ncbi:DNA mismatch repair protein MutS [Bacteroidota bacterium]|nr:DNA mismatch repair protein MutS [Bacteroidota bacterium]